MIAPVALWLAGLLACGGEGPDTGSTGSGEDATEPIALARQWSADEVETALRLTLDGGLPEPFTIRSWFHELLEVRVRDTLPSESGGCPPYQDGSDINGTVLSDWEGDCVSDPWEIHGGWLWQETHDADTPSGDQLTVDGVLSFTGAHSGEEVLGGGSVYLRRTVSGDGVRSASLKLGGTIKDGSEDGWLGDGVSLGLELDGQLSEGQLVATFEGSLSINPENALYFDGLSLDGALCGTDPAGVIRVRDPSTGWFELDFGESCSPCAALSFGEEALGELCPEDALYVAGLEVFESGVNR